jgi:hypothetical protein
LNEAICIRNDAPCLKDHKLDRPNEVPNARCIPNTTNCFSGFTSSVANNANADCRVCKGRVPVEQKTYRDNGLGQCVDVNLRCAEGFLANGEGNCNKTCIKDFTDNGLGECVESKINKQFCANGFASQSGRCVLISEATLLQSASRARCEPLCV